MGEGERRSRIEGGLGGIRREGKSREGGTNEGGGR